MRIFKPITNFLTKGSDRSVNVKKNIVISFFLKGLNIGASLLYVPATIKYLDTTRYGIWITLTSIVAWFSLFDVGLGNGLRNNLATALANDEKLVARKLVSTTYALLVIISASIAFLFFIINHWLYWPSILNTQTSFQSELSKLAVIVIFLFCLKFVLQVIDVILLASQRPAFSSLLEVSGSVLGLVAILFLAVLGKTSLLNFGIAIMSIPALVFLVASIILFSKKYRFLRPGLKYVDFSYSKSLLGLGLKFFMVQIAVIIIFQTSNIIIAQLFSPASVTPYNIAYKYFSVIIMVWGIVVTPMWSAFTHAMATKDYKWIQRTIRKLNYLMIFVAFVILIMFLAAPPIIALWTNKRVVIGNRMLIIFSFYAMIQVWNNTYSYFLNGTGLIRIQVITSIIASIIHVPLSIFLVKYLHFGPEGVVLSMAISLSIFGVAGSIKSFKIINKWVAVA